MIAQKVILIKAYLFLLLAGCASVAPIGYKDLRWEAEGEMRKLSKELEPLETKEDVLRLSPRLKASFLGIAKLLIKARSFPLAEEEEISPASEALFRELARLYEIPGVRDAIESLQTDAILLLERTQEKVSTDVNYPFE
ncbi:MAG: hypothetical protein KGI80_05210 [Verrucomicrobiota bacterium]|nr:hypothetical protein [Verrucomicrobiota bacterium]